MHPDVHRHLDGELPREALDARARGELDAWESLMADARHMAAERAPADLCDRVMDAIPATTPAGAATSSGAWRRAAAWLLAPRPLRVRPAFALAAAAALVATGALALAAYRATVVARSAPSVAATAPAAAPATALVYVQFVYDGGAAKSVAVAGDFNGWDAADFSLRDPDGDGVWTAMFPLPVGLHKYMFVVDGERWVTDPRAQRHVEDGFGMRNALIAVATPPPGPS